MPRTASASPLGEGEEGRPRRTVLDFGLTAEGKVGARPRRPSPPDRGSGAGSSPLPQGRGRKRGDLTIAVTTCGGGGGGVWVRGGPLTECRGRLLPLPLERVKRGGPGGRVLDFGLAASPRQPPSPPDRSPGQAPALSLKGEGERAAISHKEFDPGPSCVVAGMGVRGTPHRLRPRTPESASPLGEGEEGRIQLRECVNGWLVGLGCAEDGRVRDPPLRKIGMGAPGWFAGGKCGSSKRLSTNR